MHVDRPITIALFIIIILLLVFLLVMPEYDTFKSLQSQLGNKMAEYVAQHDYYAEIDKIYYDLQAKQDDIAKIDDALSTDPNLGKTVYFLQGAAKKNGLILKSLFLSKSSTGSGDTKSNATKEISFSVSLMGNYPSLGGFISTLENSSRIFEITSIAFGAGDGPPYSFSLQIKTYSY
jgi:Tfp pilus assembly protein PilO